MILRRKAFPCITVCIMSCHDLCTIILLLFMYTYGSVVKTIGVTGKMLKWQLEKRAPNSSKISTLEVTG